MLTCGIDLAAEPAKTAVATLSWHDGRATVQQVRLGADDRQLLAAIGESFRTGIDCPLGWPDTFVEFVARQRDGTFTAPADVAGSAWRRPLSYRKTDEFVRRQTGLIPLSVSTDRIGVTAMRAVSLLADLAAAGFPVDRSGVGAVAEVYPAAALRHWGIRHRGYKGVGNATVLTESVSALAEVAPWLELGDFGALCRRSDDAFDAVIAALVARAAALGAVTWAAGEDAVSASTEGWILLPTCGLDALPG